MTHMGRNRRNNRARESLYGQRKEILARTVQGNPFPVRPRKSLHKPVSLEPVCLKACTPKPGKSDLLLFFLLRFSFLNFSPLTRINHFKRKEKKFRNES